MMNSAFSTKKIGLLLSGGLDSCILLGHLIEQGYRVQPFYVCSQLRWEPEELRAVDAFLTSINNDHIEPLIIFDMPLKDVYGKHWSTDGENVPDAFSPDNAVYLPGRNALLIIKASIWCQLNGIDQLALAVLESNPFGDATNQFFNDFVSALDQATGKRVDVVRPFSQFDKKHVMEIGRHLPLDKTFSCISPINGRHCGACNKCAERQKAFESAGIIDPTEYHIKE